MQSSKLTTTVKIFFLALLFLLPKAVFANMANPAPTLTFNLPEGQNELIVCGEINIYGNKLSSEELTVAGDKISSTTECFKLQKKDEGYYRSFMAGAFQDKNLTFFTTDFQKSWQASPISAENHASYLYDISLQDSGKAELSLSSSDKHEPSPSSGTSSIVLPFFFFGAITLAFLAIGLLIFFFIFYFVSKNKSKKHHIKVEKS